MYAIKKIASDFSMTFVSPKMHHSILSFNSKRLIDFMAYVVSMIQYLNVLLSIALVLVTVNPTPAVCDAT